MKKLRETQHLGRQYPPHINRDVDNFFEEIPPINRFDSQFNEERFSFNDYHKNHISRLFDPEYEAINDNYNNSKKIYEFNKNIDKKMREFKKEICFIKGSIRIVSQVMYIQE